MKSIEFIFLNKIFIVEYNEGEIKLIEKKTGEVVKLTEEHLQYDDPLLNLVALIIELIR